MGATTCVYVDHHFHVQVLGAEDITPEFRDNRIFLGGDVGLDTTFLLHPHGQLPVSGRTSFSACSVLSCTGGVVLQQDEPHLIGPAPRNRNDNCNVVALICGTAG